MDQDNLYAQSVNSYGESSTSNHHLNRSSRRYPHGQSSVSEKKARMTKKQKYDAMINEEKNLINPHMAHSLSNSDQQNITYTELKPTNQLLIPNSVYDISGGYKKQQPPIYQSPSAPISSL